LVPVRQCLGDPETGPLSKYRYSDFFRAPGGYYPLGEENWSQTNGKVDAFVHCVGTAASSRGVATVLKRHKPDVQDGRSRARGILGVARRRAGTPQDRRSWERLHSTAMGAGPVGRHHRGRHGGHEADDPALAREESLFAGTSSGVNVVAAMQVAEKLEPGATVVTLMADSGLKYLSTDVYRSR
jgi:cysteine synthase